MNVTYVARDGDTFEFRFSELKLDMKIAPQNLHHFPDNILIMLEKAYVRFSIIVEESFYKKRSYGPMAYVGYVSQFRMEGGLFEVSLIALEPWEKIWLDPYDAKLVDWGMLRVCVEEKNWRNAWELVGLTNAGDDLSPGEAYVEGYMKTLHDADVKRCRWAWLAAHYARPSRKVPSMVLVSTRHSKISWPDA